MAKKARRVIESIGEWSEIKIALLEDYAKAYATIFSAEKQKQVSFHTVYIDGFAGSGLKRLRTTGEEITGSPLRVLSIKPPFSEYHFIDEDHSRIETLTDEVNKLGASKEINPDDVNIHVGDAITILEKELIPSITYESYKRSLLFLDPYGLDIPWTLIEKAASQRTIDILLNFSIMDLNRNHLPARRELLTDDQRVKVLPFLGSGWENEIYPESSQSNLFGTEYEKLGNDDIMLFYASRLESKAGFKFVSEPLLFSHKGANLYYLVLASQKEPAKRIMNSLVSKYRKAMK